MDFPGGSVNKASACSAENAGSIPGLVRSPGEENYNPLQYSCLENLMNRGTYVHFSTCRLYFNKK